MKKFLFLCIAFLMGLTVNAQTISKVHNSALQKAYVAQRLAKIRHRNATRAAEGESSIYTGKKKALVILAEYADVPFQKENTVDFFKKVCNEPNFSERDFKGSVRDYFLTQSNNQFDLSFDVLGVCKLKQNRAYYSQNNEAKGHEMLVEACNWAKEQNVDFSQYDWDGDGYVEEVFILFSGNGIDKTAINPYMSYLSWDDYNNEEGMDVGNDIYVDQYACSCELYNNSRVSGIGSFCHEFSHCMGFPDVYGDYTGMGYYDIMDYGLYNGDEYQPIGYSAWEKAQCGWTELKDMTNIDKQVDISGITAVSEGGDAYIIKNKGNENEFYVIEYRRKSKSDAAMLCEGLMITHIDYDEDIWYYNMPNSYGYYYAYENGKWVTKLNDHARYALVPADGKADLSGAPLYNGATTKEFSKTSTPAATLYNENADGTKYLHVAVKNIKRNRKDGTMSLSFVPDGSSTGIQNISNDADHKIDSYYTIDGIRLTQPQKGINIIRYSDGHTQKVVY